MRTRVPLVALLKRASSSIRPKSPTLHNAKRAFTAPLPPPEVVEPFCDLSDVVSARSQPSPWLPQILALIDGSPSMEPNLTLFCRKFLISLSPSFVAHTLTRLSDPLSATRFFSWAQSQPNYSHSLDCHLSLLPLLDAAALRPAIASLRRANFPLTLPAAHSLAATLAAHALVDDLLWLLQAMKLSHLQPTLSIHNSLINALVNASLVTAAEKVLKAMHQRDVVSYNTLMKGLCKAGRTRHALASLCEMEGEGIPPDEVTYMTLIQACYNEGDVDCCLRLYHEMEEKGVGMKIPPHVYSLVICGLCKVGKVVEGCVVFEGMVKRECKGHKAVYTAVIDGFAKSGDLDSAMAFFERMKGDGVEPDEVTYGAVVSGLCKGGRVEEALGYFRFCKESGVGVNAVFYSSLIDGLGKVGRVDEAERLFEEMVGEGCLQDSYCYNALMDGLCKNGRVDEALALFRRMEQEGCEQTVYTFTILISELFKERRNEDALKMWDEMIDKGVTPNVACFRALSIGLCLSGKVARACKVLDELAPMGIVLETAYEDMLGVLCKAGRLKEACKLADGIVHRGREIPGKVRTVLINALRKAGNADLAIKLMHSKIGIGYDRVRSVKKRVKFQTLIDS